MKQIILVRHSRAEKAKPGKEDTSRPLTKKGRKLATALAAAVRKAGFAPDLIWTSPAARASETALIFAKSMKHDPAKIIEKPEFYTIKTGETFLEMLHQLEEEVNTVLFVGHEPAFNNFASLLAPAFNHQMTSPCVVIIELNKKIWKQITRKSGSLKSVLFPMDKTQRSRYRKAVRKALQNEIMPRLAAIFEGFHRPSKKLSKLINKQSKELVTAFLTLEKRRSTLTEAEIVAALNELKPREIIEPEPTAQLVAAATPKLTETNPAEAVFSEPRPKSHRTQSVKVIKNEGDDANV